MGQVVTIRRVARGDGPALVRGHGASVDLHHPWVEPFRDMAGFRAWFAQTQEGRKTSFVIENDGAIAGVVNLNEIVRGPFLSAYLAYYGMAGVIGRGVMTRGVGLVVAEAFGALGLHRVEANIQPGNAPSRALVQRLGFRLEGFSPRYLRIAGAWRDHERWALLADDVAPLEEAR